MNENNLTFSTGIFSSPYARQDGFNLIEVLVALVVLALGLLGMAALQNFSLANTHQSLQRTQATIIIQDIIDKMRANPAAAKDGLYVISSYSNIPPTLIADCAITACTPSAMAIYDMNLWMTYLTGVQALGPSAMAQIINQDAIMLGVSRVGTRYQVGVRWVENDLTLTQTMTVEAP